MSAAVLTKVAPAASKRILADASALVSAERAPKEPALERLEQAIGRDFADRLVAALSEKSGDTDTEQPSTGLIDLEGDVHRQPPRSGGLGVIARADFRSC